MKTWEVLEVLSEDRTKRFESVNYFKQRCVIFADKSRNSLIMIEHNGELPEELKLSFGSTQEGNMVWEWEEVKEPVNFFDWEEGKEYTDGSFVLKVSGCRLWWAVKGEDIFTVSGRTVNDILQRDWFEV